MENETPQPQVIPGEMSCTIGKLAFALSKLQSEIGQPNKTQTAKVPLKSGGSYTYKYADLADCIRTAQPLLAKYELAVIQTVKTGKGWVVVKTMVAHSSGEFISSAVYLPVGDEKPQSYGSAITYARRYGYCAPLGISPDEDEDGNIAQDAKQPAPKQNNQAKPRPPFQPKQGQPQTPNTGAPPPVPTVITEKQAKRLYAITAKRGWTNQEMKEFLSKEYGIQSSKEIKVLDYDTICKTVETTTFPIAMGFEKDPADEFPDDNYEPVMEDLPWPES